MNVHELLTDFQTQPQKEGRARIGAVLGEFAADCQVGVLGYVGGIDAALKPPVHAQSDHALKAVPVALNQDGKGDLVALVGGVQQFLVGAGIGTHAEVPISVPGNTVRKFTALASILFWPPRTSKSLPRDPGIEELHCSGRWGGRKKETGS